MTMHILLRWVENAWNRGKPCRQYDDEIFVISECRSPKESPEQLKKYFRNINYTKKITDFSFFKLLFGRYHFSGIPNKKSLSLFDKIKRKIIKSFYTNYEKTTSVWNLIDIITTFQSKKNIFVPGEHVVEIYKYHFPDYHVEEITSYSDDSQNHLIYNLALISHKWLAENEDGVAVFANTIDHFLLKAYKLLHPNKKIYVRLHDCIDFFTNDAKKFKNDLRFLIENKIIDGAESYCKEDAELLEIPYKPNSVNARIMKGLDTSVREYLYIFVGAHRSTEDTSRLDAISEVREKLCEIFPSAPTYIMEHIISFDDFRLKRIPYKKYLACIAKSEIMIDMCRMNQNEGFSFRIPEALVLNKKVITNRMMILNSVFYDPARFFVIGYDSIERLESFVKGNIEPLRSDILNKFQCNGWKS